MVNYLEAKQNVAALYLRLSKEDIDKISKGDDSESIKNQRLLLTDEAIKRGFIIGNVYSDEDYSGTDSSRPAFLRLIEDAKLKKFNIVLCKSQSRFTRDMAVSEQYINGMFPLLGIRFISIVDHVDTDIKGNKKARQINALINEWYVEDLSDNIKSVYRSKMRQGQFLGSFAVYGYQKDKADKHKLVIDEDAAEVVREIFQLYLSGYGTKSICLHLQEKGILVPSQYKKSKGLNYKTPYDDRYNGMWSQSTVKRILSNESYIGTLIQGREKKISYKSKKVVLAPKEEWVVIKDNHEPIISKEDFYKVQELLKMNRKNPKKTAPMGKFYPLAGKVKCKDCRSTMVRSGTKGTNANYLRCRLASKSASRECTNHNIKYSLLEERILATLQEHVNDMIDNQPQLDDIAAQLVPMEGGRKKELEASIKKLYQEQEKLNTGLRNCYIDKYSGEMDEDMFLRIKEEYSRKIKSINQEIEITEGKLSVYCSNSQISQAAHDILKKYSTFTELTNEMAYDFIDFVEIGEKNEAGEQDVIIHWNF